MMRSIHTTTPPGGRAAGRTVLAQLRRFVLCLALATAGMTTAACGDAKDPQSAPIDAGPEVSEDAGGDVTATQPAAQVVAGGGTLTGGGVRMDIQLGHATSQRPTQGGAVTVQPHSAIER